MSELIDRRLLAFLLYDWLAVDRLPERARFADHSRASFDAFIDAADVLAQREFAPHNRLSDQYEPEFADGRVRIIPEVKRALDAFTAGGFSGAAQDAKYGGLQLPVVIEKACFAHFLAANVATAAYPFLTLANASLLLAHAAPAQIDAFARPQLAGRFFGTMCLSEPQAGSSLADIRTRATVDGDDQFGARYRLTGSKMWISGGEHDLAENIIHLVLAKIAEPDGSLPSGTSGISIFCVPRTLVNGDGSLAERNDVALAGVNHKMGYRGTVNTLLNFGEGKFTPRGRAGAIGYRIGAPGQGLAIMFHMMNEARIGVGLGATMLGYAGYRYALQYARERTQGRARARGGRDARSAPVPIIQHSDVRRMLLAQKAYCEGALALNLLCARLVDDERTAPQPPLQREAAQLLALLTPIAKSWPSQWCLEANNLAIQVLGGYGYTRDYPVEQYWRDNRLNAIHEGTHGIQALDLLGRRIAIDNGAALGALSARIERTVQQTTQDSNDAEIQRWGDSLARRHWRLLAVTALLGQCAEPACALANASLYLEAFGHVVIAWIWLEQALAARRLGGDADETFVVSRRQACRYFIVYELPRVDAQFDLLAALDTTTVALDEAAL